MTRRGRRGPITFPGSSSSNPAGEGQNEKEFLLCLFRTSHSAGGTEGKLDITIDDKVPSNRQMIAVIGALAHFAEHVGAMVALNVGQNSRLFTGGDLILMARLRMSIGLPASTDPEISAELEKRVRDIDEEQNRKILENLRANPKKESPE